MNALEIRNLKKAFSGFRLEDLNLTLPAGCILGLIGENGAGKSTTIRLILLVFAGMSIWAGSNPFLLGYPFMLIGLIAPGLQSMDEGCKWDVYCGSATFFPCSRTILPSSCLYPRGLTSCWSWGRLLSSFSPGSFPSASTKSGKSGNLPKNGKKNFVPGIEFHR